MFDALLDDDNDDDSVAAPASPAAAAAAAAAAPGHALAVQRPRRGGVERHSETTRLKIQLATSKISGRSKNLHCRS